LKPYRVRLTPEVEADLLDLFDYIARKDSADSAYYVLDHLESLILSLEEHPERGHYPPELHVHGVKDFREVFFKPYRLIYQVMEDEVVVLGCFDGRRDMQILLERRLLR
jgi:toxin ParE1/3/4